jgi:hypothetical protein
MNSENSSQTVLDSKRTTIHPRQRGERGSGTTITIDLSDRTDLLSQIRDAAKADDREPSKFLRRRIVQLWNEGKLFGAGKTTDSKE